MSVILVVAWQKSASLNSLLSRDDLGGSKLVFAARPISNGNDSGLSMQQPSHHGQSTGIVVDRQSKGAE